MARFDKKELPEGATRLVQTPVGSIVAYPKHKEDNDADYPGIYIDFIPDNGGEDVMLACIEYDSVAGGLMACVYGNGLSDEPTSVEHYRNLEVEA